ncbi:TetR/AcrR family transcriptional regulator [Kineococcus xinjiangensis]|nr:TetR/AcrR family transcriptional regulator [Kineococcus xinjiangensis]
MARERRRLSAEDWAEAALQALGDGGLAAVAVEPLAARLGATKGSFYWHFANREALVTAALELWERRSTEATIASLTVEADPVQRLRMLFTRAAGRGEGNPAELAVRAAATNDTVAPVLRRVMQRRVGYLVGLFEEIGFGPAEAARRAMLAHTAYLGHGELETRLPGTLPLDRAGGLPAYVDSVLTLLLADAPRQAEEAPR